MKPSSVLLALLSTGAIGAVAWCGYGTLQQYQAHEQARTEASTRAKAAAEATWEIFKTILNANREAVARLAADPAVTKSWNNKDRPALAKAVSGFLSKNGVEGWVTVIGKDGKVFYSSDAPDRFGYSVVEQVPELAHVLADSRYGHYSGALTPTQNKLLCLGNMQNFADASGVVALSEPLNDDFLLKLQQELQSSSAIQGIDLVAFNIENNHVQGCTPLLKKNDHGYLLKLRREGLGAVKSPAATFEECDRVWRCIPLMRAEGLRTPGVVIAGAAVTVESPARQTSVDKPVDKTPQ